jgi:hypothetical protein
MENNDFLNNNLDYNYNMEFNDRGHMAPNNAMNSNILGYRVEYRLYIKDEGETSIELLRFIDKNMIILRKIGIYLKIIAIDENDIDDKLLRQLNSKKIKRFPSLKSEKGGVISGKEEIKNVFNTAIKNYEKEQINLQRQHNKFSKGSHDDPLVNEFYSNEMNETARKRDLKYGEDFHGEGDALDTNDINRRMARQSRQRKIDIPVGDDMENDLEIPTRKNRRRETQNDQNNDYRQNNQQYNRRRDNLAPEMMNDSPPITQTPITKKEIPTMGKGEQFNDDMIMQRFLEGM